MVAMLSNRKGGLKALCRDGAKIDHCCENPERKKKQQQQPVRGRMEAKTAEVTYWRCMLGSLTASSLFLYKCKLLEKAAA